MNNVGINESFLDMYKDNFIYILKSDLLNTSKSSVSNPFKTFTLWNFKIVVFIWKGLNNDMTTCFEVNDFRDIAIYINMYL